MSSDFERTLAAIAAEGAELTRQLIVGLSGATRSESHAFLALLDNLSAQRRQELLLRMTAYAEENFELDFVDLFRISLKHTDPTVRRYAIEGLWEDDRPGLADTLVALLSSDPDVAVRAAAASALGRFVFMHECDELDERRGTRVCEGLEHTIADEKEIDVVRRAIESLAFVNSDAVRIIIEQAYAHSDQRMRESAVFAMGRSADPAWAEIVLDELDSSSAAMRYQAARASGELQLAQAVNRLIQLTGEPDRDIAEMAIWSLGQIGGRRAKEALERWVESEDERFSAVAEEALSELEFGEMPLDMLVHDPTASGYRDLDAPQDLDEWDELEDAPDLDQNEDQDEDEDEEWPEDFLEIG
jgi:HEAT repeat protein